MSLYLDDPERRLVPRWRDSLTTLSTRELEPVGSSRPITAFGPEYFSEKLEEWRNQRSLFVANELVAAAVSLGLANEAEEAARFLLDHQRFAPEASIRMARSVLSLSSPSHEEDPPPDPAGAMDAEAHIHSVQSSRQAVRLLRKALPDQPRNAIMWTDLARHYVTLGVDEKARAAVEMSLRLAGDNRFILRSAARFFVHDKQADRAHRVLRRSRATPSDPWLIGAEIAVAKVAGEAPKFVRRARELLKSGDFGPFHLTELAASLASLHLAEGDNRKARQLFRTALTDPTDNTVAQAEWASRRLDNFEVGKLLLDTPRSFEARAWENFTDSRWDVAVDECVRWFADEPFSSRPVMLGTHAASVGLENYSMAIRLARRWLATNPEDQIVRNNLAFALASAGQLTEAEEESRLRDTSKDTPVSTMAWTATTGLIAFRKGRIHEGRAKYREAIALANQLRLPDSKAMALGYLTREELLAGTAEGVTMLMEVNAAVGAAPGPAIRALVRRLEKLAAGPRSPAGLSE